MAARKKAPILLRPVRNYQRELQALYTRRSALDAIIASLEAYDRYRAPSLTGAHDETRKTA